MGAPGLWPHAGRSPSRRAWATGRGNSCRLLCSVASTCVPPMLVCFKGPVQGRVGPAASGRLSANALKSVLGIHLLKDVSSPRGFAGAKQLNIYHFRRLVNASTGSSLGATPPLHMGRSRWVFLPQASTLSAAQAVNCYFFPSKNDFSSNSRSSRRPTSDGFEAPQAIPALQHEPAKEAPGNAPLSQSAADRNSNPAYSAKPENLQHKKGETGLEEPVSAPSGEKLHVSLWELLLFIREEKFRMGAILFALLLSSGAQLLLPVAVGQLIDAVTSSQPQNQQQQKPELMQGNTFDSEQKGDLIAGGQVEVAGVGRCRAEVSSFESQLAKNWKPEDVLEQRALLESLGDVFKTPAARVGLCGFLGALGTAATFMRLYFLESTMERVACRLRSSLLRQLLYQSPQASQHQKLGALVKHLSQDVVTTSRILIDLSFGLRCLTISAVGIGLCWTIAPLSFLLSLLLPVCAAAFLLRASGRRVSALQQQHSRALQRALQRATGALGARKQLRSLNAEAYELKAFDSAVRHGRCRYAFVFAAASGLLVHLVNSAANLVAQGVLTGGQVMSLALYSAIVGSSLQGCVTAWSDTSRAVAAAAEMLQQLVRGPPKALATRFSYEAERRRYQASLRQLQTGAAAEFISSDRRGPSLDFKDVWFSYPERGKHWALKGIDFTIPPGAKVAILGKCNLCWLYACPTWFFTADASSSLALNAACDAACVTSFASALPEGLKTPLGEKGAVLSGGQRQRVCLAMALYRLGQSQRSPEQTLFQRSRADSECSEGDLPRLPTVLLLDEATSSLDAATENQVLLNLKQTLQGETCLFISHRPGTLEICDHIAVMDGGRLIQFGRKKDVLSRPCPPLQWLVSGALAKSQKGERPP
ncbi:hypothetical protein ACSSS7_003251 [Eimeria intestinalis]